MSLTLVLVAIGMATAYETCTEYCKSMTTESHTEAKRPDCACITGTPNKDVYSKGFIPVNNNNPMDSTDPTNEVSLVDEVFHMSMPRQKKSIPNSVSKKLNRPRKNKSFLIGRLDRTHQANVDKFPFYLDIDIYKPISNMNPFDSKIIGINNIQELEKKVIECIGLHFLVHLRKAGNNFDSILDQEKFNKYNSLPDSELTVKIENKCEQLAKIIDESLKAIKKSIHSKTNRKLNNSKDTKDSRILHITPVGKNIIEKSPISIERKSGQKPPVNLFEPSLQKFKESLIGTIFPETTLRQSDFTQSSPLTEMVDESYELATQPLARQLHDVVLSDHSLTPETFITETENIIQDVDNSNNPPITSIWPVWFKLEPTLIKELPRGGDASTERGESQSSTSIIFTPIMPSPTTLNSNSNTLEKFNHSDVGLKSAVSSTETDNLDLLSEADYLEVISTNESSMYPITINPDDNQYDTSDDVNSQVDSLPNTLFDKVANENFDNAVEYHGMDKNNSVKIPEPLNFSSEYTSTGESSESISVTTDKNDVTVESHTEPLVVNLTEAPNYTVFEINRIFTSIEREKYNPNDLNLPRILTKEFANDTVVSEVNGAEIMQDSKIANYSKNYSNINIEDAETDTDTNVRDRKEEITGKLIFLFGKHSIPARFVQSSAGELKLGLDGIELCQKITENGLKDSILMSALCNLFII